MFSENERQTIVNSLAVSDAKSVLHLDAEKSQLRQQLAESQAREAKLREKVAPFPRLAYNTGFFHLQEFFEELLAIPSDNTGLRELLNSKLEEAATVCEKSDRYRGDYFAEKIRALKE